MWHQKQRLPLLKLPINVKVGMEQTHPQRERIPAPRDLRTQWEQTQLEARIRAALGDPPGKR